MARARRGETGKHAAVVSRRKRRTAAIAASALVTLPAALFGNAAGGWVSPAAASVPASATPNATNPAALGATGTLGDDGKLSPAVLHDAGNPVALTTDTGPLANLPSGPLGIPGIVLSAYEKAAQQLAFSDPGCRLPWWLLAGIGKVESNQAENGEVGITGNTLRPIYGPVLDGNGFAAIPDTDNGTLDGDTTWDRAVGPMQFLPSTWRQYGTGSPSNVFDAALAAGRYLCASGGDLSDPAQQAIAVFNYNHSDSYVRLVLIWADAYEQGVTPLPETLVSTLDNENKGNPTRNTGSTKVTQSTNNGTTTTVTTTTSATGTTTTTTTTTTSSGGQTATTTATTTTTTSPTTPCTTAPTTTTTGTATTTEPTTTGSATTTAPTTTPTSTTTTAPTSTTTTTPTPTC